MSDQSVKRYRLPSVEELALLNRLQPEVQRRNNWLEGRIVALQTENEKLREQLPNAFREGFYRGFQAAFEDAAKEAALQKEGT